MTDYHEWEEMAELARSLADRVFRRAWCPGPGDVCIDAQTQRAQRRGRAYHQIDPTALCPACLLCWSLEVAARELGYRACREVRYGISSPSLRIGDPPADPDPVIDLADPRD